MRRNEARGKRQGKGATMTRGGTTIRGGTMRRGPDEARGSERHDRAGPPALSFFFFLSRAEPSGSALFLFLLYLFHVPRHIPKEESLLGNNEFI